MRPEWLIEIDAIAMKHAAAPQAAARKPAKKAAQRKPARKTAQPKKA